MNLFKKGLLALLFLFLAVSVLAVDYVTTSINVLDQMPHVSNLTIYPSNISFGGYVNVSVNVTAYHGVNKVLMQIKISNGTTVNYTMVNSTNLDVYNYTYFVHSSYPAGVYNITIIANSTYNTINSSTIGNFTVSDTRNPVVIINYPLGNNLSKSSVVTFNVTVTDDSPISSVYVNVTYGLSNQLISMSFSGGYYYGTFSDSSAVGQYNFTIIANDSAGNLNDSVSSFFNIIESAVTPTPSAATRNNRGDLIGVIVRQTHGWYNPSANSKLEMDILDDRLIVNSVAITLIEDFNGFFRMTVSESKKMEGVSGVIYGFFKIDAPAVNFRNGVVNIKISKNWISENNIDEIFLYNYGGDSWSKNNVNFVKDDENYAYYSVNIDSFGTFAIAGSLFSIEEKAAKEEITYKTPVGQLKIPGWTAYIALVWAILLVIMLLFVIYLLIINKSEKS